MTRILLLAAAILQVACAFSPSSAIVKSRAVGISRFHPRILSMADGDGVEASEESSPASSALSLEEKMKSWDASEEEVRAATLGGVVPGGSGGDGRTDAFDVGLYIAFPIMVVSCLAFVFFPLIVGNIDVTSVGPPPTS